MWMVPEALAAEYARSSDERLIELARSYHGLVPAAQGLLRAEFERRGLDPPLLDEVNSETAMDLVTVRRFRDLPEALVARATLETAGLLCFLRDENMVRLDWAYSNALGGIRLEVPSDQAATADALLATATTDGDMNGREESGEDTLCPRCGSPDIATEPSGRGRALVSLFLLSVPLPLGEMVGRCDHCGARWTDAEE